MLVKNEIYNKYVLEDLKTHNGLLQPAKAHFFERLKPRNVDPTRIHPNPNDEFSMESIGPNWGIVGNYERDICLRQKHSDEIFEEPLIGVKLKKQGYMLLNGHHRWMAALNLRISSVPLEIVNTTIDDDIIKKVNKSKRDRCATIDLDEVLLTNNKPHFPFSLGLKESIRVNADLLISEFQTLGYDVWVYTGSYKSESYIKWLFRACGCHVDGIVNGINGKHSKKMADIFRSKYKHIVHVSNELITCVNTETKDFESFDITADNEAWASAVALEIKKFGKSEL